MTTGSCSGPLRQPPPSAAGGGFPGTGDNELGPRSVRLPDHDIRSEHQLVPALWDGVYHLDGHPTRRELIGARNFSELAERLAEAEGLYDL